MVLIYGKPEWEVKYVKEVIKCNRCGRKLKHPIRLDGKVYGSTCFEKVLMEKGIVNKKLIKVIKSCATMNYPKIDRWEHDDN